MYCNTCVFSVTLYKWWSSSCQLRCMLEHQIRPSVRMTGASARLSFSSNLFTFTQKKGDPLQPWWKRSANMIAIWYYMMVIEYDVFLVPDIQYHCIIIMEGFDSSAADNQRQVWFLAWVWTVRQSNRVSCREVLISYSHSSAADVEVRESHHSMEWAENIWPSVCGSWCSPTSLPNWWSHGWR